MTETTKPEPISEARLDELIEWYSDDSLIGPWDESVVSALRELKALRQENEWISVGRMPEDLEDERVLLCVMEEVYVCDDILHRYEIVSTGYVTFFPQGGMATTDCEGGEYEEKDIVGYRHLPAPPAPRTEEK